MKKYVKASIGQYESVADVNFFEYGFLVAKDSGNTYDFLMCEPFPDEDDLFLFGRGTVDLDDDWIDLDKVTKYAGITKESDPSLVVEACVSYYGPEQFGEAYEMTRLEVLKELTGENLPANINFDGYYYKDALLVCYEEANKKDYLQRALGQINATVTYNFNTLREMMASNEDLVMVNEYYYPRKAIKWIETADSYQDFHLNKNMDLTVSNILNAVEGYESPEDYIRDLFEEYKPDSALSWADNFIEVLKHLSSEDKWDDGNYDRDSYED